MNEQLNATDVTEIRNPPVTEAAETLKRLAENGLKVLEGLQALGVPLPVGLAATLREALDNAEALLEKEILALRAELVRKQEECETLAKERDEAHECLDDWAYTLNEYASFMQANLPEKARRHRW